MLDWTIKVMQSFNTICETPAVWVVILDFQSSRIPCYEGPQRTLTLFGSDEMRWSNMV